MRRNLKKQTIKVAENVIDGAICVALIPVIPFVIARNGLERISKRQTQVRNFKMYDVKEGA